MSSILYTDGSCLVNPNGPGGWAFILIENNMEYRVSGQNKSTTNNRMELEAVIEGLSFCQNTHCSIYTDSTLVLKCAQGLWKRKKNLDLWAEYDRVSKNKTLVWTWVKGHSGDHFNSLVDEMAKAEAKLVEKEKRKKS